MEIKQYDVVLVNLDPTVGSEIRKSRPCVVISPDEMNRHLKTVVILPVTSQSKNYPTRVQIIHRGQINWAAVDQVRTIDRIRIIKFLFHLQDKEILAVKRTIREAYID